MDRDFHLFAKSKSKLLKVKNKNHKYSKPSTPNLATALTSPNTSSVFLAHELNNRP